MSEANPEIERLSERFSLRQFDRADHRQEFMEDVGEGLDSVPKSIPPKYFYDERGSQLFERITETPEYYPTRTEADILSRFADEIVRAVGGGMGLACAEPRLPVKSLQ